MMRLDDLKKDAAQLWNIHLSEFREDTASVIAIKKILCVEKSIHHWWRSVQQAVNPNRGGAVTWLKVPHPAGDTLYSTKDGESLRGGQQLKHGAKWHWGHLFCKIPAFTMTLDSWQTWIPLVRSYRAHTCTPRIWMHIANFLY